MNRPGVQRVLVYTHNSIGLGHAFRTLAVITGMKRLRPDIDFLVLSSTSIPQIFFNEGIEVIKLPSIKLDIDRPNDPMVPRYLTNVDLESIFDFRQRLILETFDFFRPDALIVEHNMTGQMSELIPVLMKKWMRKDGPGDFALIHISRGIMKWVPLLEIPYQNPRHRSESINIGELYDRMYVLENRDVIDINKAFLGNDPGLEPKIKYLGKVTNKSRDELAARKDVFERFQLPDLETVLISLGRNEKVFDISVRLMEIFDEVHSHPDRQVVMVLDPYLGRKQVRALEKHPLTRKARFVTFMPDLVDLINHSELIVSRAGYNTVNEILLTGTPAILIPEKHGSGEQEQRAGSLPTDNFLVLDEDEIMEPTVREKVLAVLSGKQRRSSVPLDKYSVGRTIVEDLESLAVRHKRAV